MTLQVFTKDKNDVQSAAAKKLGVILETWKDRPVLFLSSGGSCISILDHIDPKTLQGNMTLGLLDERYTHDEQDSNCSQIMKTAFYKRMQEKGIRYIDTRVKEGETLEQFGKRFEKELMRWWTTHPTGKIIATMGVGEDGHTGGILPNTQNPELFKKLFDEKNVVAAYEASPIRKRVTVTFPFLREKIDEVVIFITGENKRPALQKVLKASGPLFQTPALIFHELKSASLFTDLSL